MTASLLTISEEATLGELPVAYVLSGHGERSMLDAGAFDHSLRYSV